MPYFPEFYGGEMWNKALTGLGQNIAASLDDYRKRHEDATKTEETINYLHTTLNPATNKPYLDQKAWEHISTLAGHQRELAEQGILQGMEFGQQLQKSQVAIQHTQAQMEHLNRLQKQSELAGKPYFQNGQKVGVYKADGTIEYDPAWMHPKQKEEPKKPAPPPPKKGVIQGVHDWLLGETPQQGQQQQGQQQQEVAQSPQQIAQRDKAIAILKKNNKPLTEANIQWVLKQMGGGSAQ
jgi:hypothetical protein